MYAYVSIFNSGHAVLLLQCIHTCVYIFIYMYECVGVGKQIYVTKVAYRRGAPKVFEMQAIEKES